MLYTFGFKGKEGDFVNVDSKEQTDSKERLFFFFKMGEDLDIFVGQSKIIQKVK